MLNRKKLNEETDQVNFGQRNMPNIGRMEKAKGKKLVMLVDSDEKQRVDFDMNNVEMLVVGLGNG